MARQTLRPAGLALESLESRNLQSGLSGSADSALIGLLNVPTNPALIGQSSPVLNQSSLGHHNYQLATGFFGQ